LDAAIRERVAAGAQPTDAVRDVPHLETIAAWCGAHQDDAARIVLCAVYLANGHFPAQEAAEQAAPPEPVPAPVATAEPDGS
jgi:hypothetical protein